jgi:F-type H+-transporting ATPase subunit gamma
MRESRKYGQTSNTVFEQAETKPLEGDDKKTLIVVASSDKGLCGGIHSGLSKRVRKMLVEKPNADIVVLGEKCKAQLSRSSAKNIQLSFAGIGKDIPTFADAQAIADQISLLPSDYGSIQIVYNKFINATSYEATPIEAFSEEAIVNSRKSVELRYYIRSNKVDSKLRCFRNRRRSPFQSPRICFVQRSVLGTR